MRSLLVPVLLFLSFASACSDPAPLTVIVDEDDRPLVDRYFEFTPVEGLEILEERDPAKRVGSSGFRVAVARGLEGCPCEPGSYQVDGKDGQYVVRADDVLGLQYGLSAVLEAAGFRFFHPYRPHIPSPLVAPSSVAGAGTLQSPEMSLRELHLHTLHPIEPYFDFWEPSPQNLIRAKKTLDWVVKNRGNAIQYPGLDDILSSAERAAAWKEHTRAILEDAHARGLIMGVGIQLFGKSNLQKAFDLLDSEVADPKAEMLKRYRVLLEGVPFDVISLSFGEFSTGTTPADFVAKVNTAYQALQEVAPGTEMNSVIHVGNQPELRVDYQGENLLYYFLVKYADPNIVPWVHSVMYFNLYEDAGGAYFHDNFDEHKAYLLDRLNAGKRVAYMPESAYWIAFDNSVPTYLPLYTRSRWLDLHELKTAAANPLKEHALFSTGWEWGYWQTDVATLRMGFHIPDSWRAPFDDMFAPWGEEGATLANAIVKVTEAEHEGLIKRRLAAYVAGRDQLIDGGELVGIVSQPDRVSFEELQKMTPDARAKFAADVLVPIKTMEDELAGALASVNALPMDNVWFAEVRDGIEVTMFRARYIRKMYEAVKAETEIGSDGGLVAEAVADLAEARKVVVRRHAALHDGPNSRRLIVNAPNQTVYLYGYLREANSLCFWERERVEVQRLLFGSTESQPACVLN